MLLVFIQKMVDLVQIVDTPLRPVIIAIEERFDFFRNDSIGAGVEGIYGRLWYANMVGVGGQ